MPAEVTACEPFGTQPSVTLYNTTDGSRASGVAVTVNTTVQAPSGGGSPRLNGTTIVSSNNGSVRYTDLSLCATGTGYYLRHEVRFMGQTRTVYSNAFTSAGAAPPTTASPTSPPVDLSNAELRFYQQPGSGIAGSTLRVQPIVRLENRLTGGIISATASATATLYVPTYFGTSTATLVGTTTVNTTNGIMGWTNIGVSQPGYGYHLKVDVTAGSRTFLIYSTALYIQSAAGVTHDDSGSLVQPVPDVFPSSSNSASSADGAGSTAGAAAGGSPQTGEAGRSSSTLTIVIAVASVLVMSGLVFFATRAYYVHQDQAKSRRRYVPISKDGLPDPSITQPSELSELDLAHTTPQKQRDVPTIETNPVVGQFGHKSGNIRKALPGEPEIEASRYEDVDEWESVV